MNNPQKIQDYIIDQLSRADVRARAYIMDVNGHKHPKRSAYVALRRYIEEFVTGANRQNRWIAISGLRGTGKTTLLAQLYDELSAPRQRKLFVSADHAVQLLGSSITEIIEAYEVQLGEALEYAIEPVFLFIDEVQYDPLWALALKSVYDRAPNVFIVSTGSSALELNANPDTARRVITETLLPMSFAEYQNISRGVTEDKELGKELRQVLRQAQTAEDIYNVFFTKQAAIGRYWSEVDRLEVNRYLQYGTLPFMAATGNVSLAFDQLERSIDRILGSDVTKIGQFGAEIVSRIPQVLYSVADSEMVSLNSLSKTLDITRPTLTRIFNALEQAEVIYRVEPFASHTAQIRQADKYLFTTPAIRAMYFTLTGSTRANRQVLGHLLEDAVGLYLRRLFGARSLSNSITYPNQKGAADFIVRHHQITLVFETGLGKKSCRQIEQTTGLPNDRIGVVLANDALFLNKEKNVVTIPVREFLLA
jgi:predicted AAA+ superfamily ATPase